MTALWLTHSTWQCPSVSANGSEPWAGEWAAQSLAAWVDLAGMPLGRCGLYLATADSGVLEAVAFWAQRLERGAAFVNPRGFPRTLANSPAGCIAERLDIHGPCHTVMGRDEAVLGVLHHAIADLCEGEVDSTLVVALDCGGAVPLNVNKVRSAGKRLLAAAVLVRDEDPNSSLAGESRNRDAVEKDPIAGMATRALATIGQDGGGRMIGGRRSPAVLFQGLVRAVDKGHTVKLAGPGERPLTIRPTRRKRRRRSGDNRASVHKHRRRKSRGRK